MIEARYDRIPDAFDVTGLTEILDSSSFVPTRRELPVDERQKKLERHPFPSIEVPVNCHVYFTTLPDSR